jgi:8-oxo-dGTP pyrophosphatase MutT (NUDIX family)
MNTEPTKTIVGNLIYLIRKGPQGPEILLPVKAPTEKALRRGLANKRNSYGGGLEDSDTSHLSSVLRELFEEGGIVLPNSEVQEAAIITFHNNWGDYECHFFISYIVDEVSPKESREMINPQWFPVDDPPYHDMMEGDTLILPRIIARGPSHEEVVRGEIWYDKNMMVMKSIFN